MKDYSPLGHALAAMAIQFVVALIFNMWGVGAALGCMWFIAREQTQAEYRWIAKFGNGRRSNMPWWGGFDYRVWEVGSLLDWLIPVAACTTVYVSAHWPGWA